MSHTFQFSDALGYSLVELTEMHNESFQGYFFPAVMTPAATADFWRAYQIDARSCVVMRDAAGAFVGMARVGVRGKRAWCGGFGIAPAFRGNGASHLLAEQMVTVAREHNFATFQLEVLTQNTAAIKVYERAGFATTRRMIGLEIDIEHLPAHASVQTVDAPLVACLPLLLGQAQPDWEHELAAILSLPAMAVAVTHADGTTSVIIYRHTKESAHILAAVLAPTLTSDAFVALLRHLAGTMPKIFLFNEPESTRLYQLCSEVGFTQFFSQYEMFLTR